MELEGSLPHSQESATCLFPEPDWCRPCPHIPLLDDPTKYYPSIFAWVFQVVSFPRVSPPKSCIHCSSPHMCYMPRPSHSWFNHPKSIGWGVQIIKILILQFSLLPCYLVPLRPKYSPRHPILKHSQPTFFPQCEWPSFTPIKNNRQNYSSVYLNLYIFG